PSIDLFNDLLGGGGPDKRFRLFVVLHKIIFDGSNEFFDASEVAASQALLSEFAKPALDQVKPGRTGGCVMNMKARVFRQPLRHLVMFMGAVIIHDQMQIQALGNLSIKLAQKLHIFLMSMTRHTLADDRAVE